MAKVTTQVIADRLGLARSTVSMALNNSPKINRETIELVNAEARRLNYVPNSIAKAMTTGKTQVIGLISQMRPSEHIFRLLSGVTEAAESRGYLVKLIRSDWNMNAGAVARMCVEHCLSGVVVTHVWDERIRELAEIAKEYQFPVVSLLSHYREAGVYSVTSDNASGIAEALKHLHRLGHKSIAYIGGDPRAASDLERREAFVLKVQELGLPLREDFIIQCNYDPVLIERNCRDLLAPPHDRPTAMVCANDPTAMVALRTADSLGLRVPRDLSVVGFSNIQMAEYANPPLTSVEQSFEEIGRLGAEALLEAVQDSRVDFSHCKEVYSVVPSRLVIRNSTALAPGV